MTDYFIAHTVCTINVMAAMQMCTALPVKRTTQEQHSQERVLRHSLNQSSLLRKRENREPANYVMQLEYTGQKDERSV